jgi:hypothetical protein
VRAEFYKRHVADGETPKQRTDAKRPAFHRGVNGAQANGLVAVREIGSTTFIWLSRLEKNA